LLGELWLFSRLNSIRRKKIEKSKGWDITIKDNFIQTFNGKAVYFLDPKEDDFDIENIAHTLSMLCRFGGHCKEFYSVAEHSVRCSWEAPDELKLEALLHDATEAYLVDMPRPIKQVLSQYRDIEKKLDRVLRNKFSLLPEMPKEIHYIDNAMLATEKRDLMNPSERLWAELPDPFKEKIIPWTPKEAEEKFLLEFNKLTKIKITV
jgi:hypothetical protein